MGDEQRMKDWCFKSIESSRLRSVFRLNRFPNQCSLVAGSSIMNPLNNIKRSEAETLNEKFHAPFSWSSIWMEKLWVEHLSNLLNQNEQKAFFYQNENLIEAFIESEDISKISFIIPRQTIISPLSPNSILNDVFMYFLFCSQPITLKRPSEWATRR